MTETWATESALEHALEVLAERYPGEAIEIVEPFDIGWVGWECDYQGALITHDGVPELVIVDETSGDDRPVPVKLRERIDEYRRLIDDTERVLKRQQELLLAHVYVELDKLEAPPADQTGRVLQRDPGESDDDYAARQQLYVNGGRLLLDVAALPIDHVRALNLRREIGDLLDRMSLEQLERARAAVLAMARDYHRTDTGMPPHLIELFEGLADTPYDLAGVDAAAQIYAAAVKSAGGAYGHALAGVWRAWHREKGGDE